MNWDDYYKRKTQQNKQSTTWDDYYKQRKPEVQQYATESLYNPSYEPKKTYKETDFAPFSAQWQYKWDDPYKESDYSEQLRKMRNLPPQSVINQYDFSNKDDVKRFNEGLPSLRMEMQETNKNVQKDIDLYQRERQRLFEQALANKQAEVDKHNQSFWGKAVPFNLNKKEVEYIDPEEYTPAMPESLAGWQGYLDKMADYNETLETMDPDEKAYRTLIGSLPKEPDKPGFDLSEFAKWEDLQKDLWEEYLDKQAKQAVQPTVAPTNIPTGNVQKGAQQLYPMWNQQGGPTSPVPTPTPTVKPSPTPTIQPTGTPMPTPSPTPQPTRETATFGEFQRLQEQQRQEPEQRQSIGGVNRPDPSSYNRGPQKSGRDLLYEAGENKGFGDFQKLQNDMEQERQQAGDPFTAKDILPFMRRLSNVAANTVSGGNSSTFINLESWAKRMEQIVDELDTTTDAERYDELVNEYNTLLERHQSEYKTIDTGNEKANKIADTIGSLIGIGTPIPGAGFTKLEPFRPIGRTVAEQAGRPISNLLTKTAEKGASDAAIRGLHFAYQTVPAGVGSAVQFSAMQSMTNVIDPNYEDLSTKEKLEAVGNSALWGLLLGAGSAAIKEVVRVGTSYAKPFVVNKVNPKIRQIANKPWVNKLLQDKNIAEIRVDKNGNLNPNGGKTGIYMVKDNATGQIKIQVDGTNTLNVAPRANWIRAMAEEAGKSQSGSTKEILQELGTGSKTPGAQTPKSSTHKSTETRTPAGTKATLKGLGEVEVLSETDTHVKIRRANGKELDVLKTAFNKGLQTETDSKAPISPVETSNVLDEQIQGQATEATTQAQQEAQEQSIEQEEVLAPDTDIIKSEPLAPEASSSSTIQLDPKTVKVDTKRFQFKQDVDKETGAGKGLDIEKWDEYLAGTVLVWEENNGDRFIVNGHHRLAKANELGVKSINAMIIKEADGYSDVDAKLLGAKVNIAEGHGSITDAAKLFREGGYTFEQLKAEGLPMKSGNAQKGYAIAQLTDNLFNKVIDKVITENQGAIIGDKIPSDGGINDARQEFIIKQLMNKDMTNRLLEETLDAIKSVEVDSYSQETLFGSELVWNTADYEIKPKVISETKRIISSDKNAFSKIVRNAESLKRVGNVLQDDANAEQKNTLEIAIELIDKMKYAKGDEISSIFNKYAAHVQAGGSVKDAGDKAAKEIIDLISDGEYINSFMGKTPKTIAAETDTIPGQANLFGEEPVQTEQAPITEPTKGGVTSGEETGISQSEDSKDSAELPRRTETDAQADEGRNLETEGTRKEVSKPKDVYNNMPQGQLDRINNIKDLIEKVGGLLHLKDANVANENDTVESFIGRISTQESKWDGSRKLQGTAIQMLSEKGLWGNTKETENLRKALLEYTRYINKNTHKVLPKEGFATNNLVDGDLSEERTGSKNNTKLEKQTEGKRYSDNEDVQRSPKGAFEHAISSISQSTSQEIKNARLIPENEVTSNYKNAISTLKSSFGLDAHIYETDSDFENGFAVGNYIFIRNGVDPYWVYGHEMSHIADSLMPESFDAVKKSISKLTDEQIESYLSLIDNETYKQMLRENPNRIIEEMIADEFGNMLSGTHYETYLTHEQKKTVVDAFKDTTSKISNHLDRLSKLSPKNVSLSVGEARELVTEFHADTYSEDKEALKLAERAVQLAWNIENDAIKKSGKKVSVVASDGTPMGDSGIKTLGLGITPELIQTGRIDLRGFEAKNAYDIAVHAQVYRDPRFETFRVFYMKGDTIVGHEGVSSRMPSTSLAFKTKATSSNTLHRNDLSVQYKKDMSKFYNEIKDRMKRLDADGYYMLHNHPAGSMNPSQADIHVTNQYIDKVPGFKGHIIINSGKYFVLENPKYDIRTGATNFYGGEHQLVTGEDKLMTPSIEHPLLGNRVASTNSFARLIKGMQVQDKRVVLFYMNAQNQVRAIQDVPVGMFKNLEEAQNYLRGRSREFGAYRVMPSFNEKDITPGIKRNLLKLLGDGTLLDVGVTDQFGDVESYADTQTPDEPYIKKDWMGADAKGLSVSENPNNAPVIIEGDNVRIVDFDGITKAQYSKINTAMKRKGYDWRGPEDARRLLEQMGDRKGEKIYSGDQADAIKYGLGLDITPEQKAEKEFLSKAVKEFGTTSDVREAGYILSDGRMLDFSEKRDGGPAGSRSLDHRAIERIYDDLSRFDALADFVDRGNIRILPESGGIYIAKALGEKQISALSRFINYHKGEIYLDLVKDNNHNSTPDYAEYRRGTASSRILNDIDAYFESGTVPKGNPDPVFFSGRKDIEPVFYRGTVPGETRRIDEPFEAAKGKTFVARKEKSAKAYGSQIERVKAKPEAKILYEETPEFGKVTQRYRWDKDLPLMNQLRKNETIIDAVNDAIIKAEKAGYDAISFSRDSDIGTVILNEDAFVRNADISLSSRKDIVPTFYSKLEKVVEEKVPNKAMPQAILGIVESKAAGIKEEELKWIDLEGWLKDKKGKVSKDEVLEFIRMNRIRLIDDPMPKKESPKNAMLEMISKQSEPSSEYFTETVEQFKSGKASVSSFLNELKYMDTGKDLSEDLYYDLLEFNEHDSQIETEDNFIDEVESGKFENYTLPGGENYRSILFQLPDNKDSQNYQSSHWDEPNVLAHVRLNDRTGANGEKILFVEEIQSDWHQEGRKKGYKSDLDWVPKGYSVKIGENGAYQLFDESGEAVYPTSHKDIDKAETEIKAFLKASDIDMPLLKLNKVPDAPFQKTWHEFVLKRLLRYAAENDYDTIAWTTGEQQADRYDLSKHIDRLDYNSGSKHLIAMNGYNRVIDEKNVNPDQLEDYVGKEVAQKLLQNKNWDNAAGGSSYSLEGLQLKVGGEGMKGFYNRMIPAFLDKYGKKWGARVGSVDINLGGEMEATKFEDFNDYMKNKNKISTQPAIQITDAMKESVLYEGQPLFSVRKDVRETGWVENKPITGTKSRKTSNKSKGSSGVQARTATAPSSLGISKDNTATGAKPISRTDLVDFIGEYLDIPIKQGKFRQRALGIFKVHPEVIRLKDGKDIETLFHEMGHYFDKTLGLIDESLPIQKPIIFSELYSLGATTSRASYTENQIMAEGVAEFVRIFTIDPAQAKAMAPEFYKDFMKKIATVPGMKDFFDTVKTATENYINQDPENRILGNISVGPNKNKAALLSKETLDRIYTAAFDNLHPLKRAVDVITGGENIDAKDNPFIRAWLYRGVSGKVEAILKYGPVDKNGNKIGKSLEDILSMVDKDSLNDFRKYIVSKHAQELMKENIATGLAKSDVNYTVNKYDKQYEPILKELVKFQRDVMKPLVDAGIISADSFKKITKYEYYVPFNRVMDGTKSSGTGKGLEARDPLYRQKGSERDIIDPLESIIKNTFIYTNMADRNMIGKAFVDLANKYEGSGKIIDKIPPRLIPQTVMLKELEKVLSSAGADTTEIDLDQIATVFRPRGYTNKDNVITVFENGKPNYYEVIDEDLYNAFKALDQEQTPFVVKVLSIPAQVLRAGATGLNIDFIGRNIARDTIFAGISSKYGFIPFVDSIKGLAHVLKKDELFQSWLYSGGGDSELVSMDRSRIQRYQRDLLNQSGELNVLNIVRHPMDFIRLLGEYSEQATRVGVHAKALKKEGDSVSGRMLAGLASRETTVDFARMGTSVKNVNKMIAFFNSALQGGDVLVRTAMRDKGKFALRAMMYITIPSILTYLLNRDDEEYEEIPQYQKDTFWLFKVAGQWWRIPKPFEMGMMFGSLVERFLAYTDKEDPHALDGWAEQLKDTMMPDIIPTALLPLIEVWTDKDLFRNMPITPEGDKYKKPADQYGPYTSSLAKTLGKAFNYSPFKIDHLIRGYGAGVGQNISNIASKGLELTGIAEKKTEPDKPLSQKLPVIRGLTVDPERSSKSVNDFYTRLNEMETEYNRAKDEEGIELNQYAKRKELRAMRKTQIELRDLNREYKEVYADNKIDSKTKREKLSKINMERINVARKAIGKPKIRE